MMTTTRAMLVGTMVAVVLAASPWARAPQDSKAASLYRESYALEAKQDYPGALAKMREIKLLSGPSYFVTIRLAWLSYLTGDFTASAAGYAEAVAAEPKAIEPRLGLTLPLMASRNWGALERACRDVLLMEPNNAVALSRLAQALYWGGNYPDAATRYRRLTADYPSDLDYRTGLGWALLKLGRAAEARQTFEVVLAVSPDNASARLGMVTK
jgi:tetratricopeptide (TPR) repeat protein